MGLKFFYYPIFFFNSFQLKSDQNGIEMLNKGRRGPGGHVLKSDQNGIEITVRSTADSVIKS